MDLKTTALCEMFDIAIECAPIKTIHRAIVCAYKLGEIECFKHEFLQGLV
jgi:hypothetical protein